MFRHQPIAKRPQITNQVKLEMPCIVYICILLLIDGNHLILPQKVLNKD